LKNAAEETMRLHGLNELIMKKIRGEWRRKGCKGG